MSENEKNGGALMSCLFCKIIKGEIPSDKVYEDDRVLFFKDINPQAPVHILGIPKKHIPKITDLSGEDTEILGYLFLKSAELIKTFGLEGKGVRIVNNCGEEAGQSVFHIHFHILGGRAFHWPPG
jgi:histidine triad (HIT) family protein